MPVWDEFCSDCGSNQAELVGMRRSEMASWQEQAETLLKRYDYQEAKEIATALCDETDLRLQHLKGWAEQFLTDVERNREQQLQRMLELLQEALQHEADHDYQSGVQTLEQIPETLREGAPSGHADLSASGIRAAR